MDDQNGQTGGESPVQPLADTQPAPAPQVTEPASQPVPPVQPAAAGPAYGMSGFGDGGMKPEAAKRGGPGKKKMIAIAAGAVLVVAATTTYAFAYYLPNQPSNVYRSALTNSADGYDELVTYANDKDVQEKYKTAEAEGNFRFESGHMTTDGTFSMKTDAKNATFSGNIGLGVTRLQVEGKALDAANSDSPDVFLKFSGIKGLSSEMLGLPALDALDGQWVTIDHTLFDMAVKQSEDATAQAGSTGLKAPARADIVDAMRAAGEVNRKYLLSTDPAAAVLKMDSFVGKEVVDGKSVNHYKVKANEVNLKAYIKALGTALDGSKLGDWAKKNYDKKLSEMAGMEGLSKQAEEIKESDKFDLWVNTKTKLVHKIRLAESGENAAKNYADFGLNYAGGPEKPFFITIASVDGNITSKSELKLTLNTDTDVVKLAMDMRTTAEAADAAGTSVATFSFTVRPGTGAVKATVPEGTIPLSEALDKAGAGGLLQLMTGQSPTADESAMFDQRYVDEFLLQQ